MEYIKDLIRLVAKGRICCRDLLCCSLNEIVPNNLLIFIYDGGKLRVAEQLVTTAKLEAIASTGNRATQSRSSQARVSSYLHRFGRAGDSRLRN